MGEGVRRAGRNLWRWSGLSFSIVENALDLADVDPVVRSIQPEFSHVNVQRRVAGPMAGGLTPEAALLAIFAAVAIPFLAELGKDAYRAFRGALFEAYGKAKTWANNRGYSPLAIELRYVDPSERTGENFEPNVYFAFPPSMDAAEFERALQALLASYADVDRGTPAYYVVLEFDRDVGSWKEAYRE